MDYLRVNLGYLVCLSLGPWLSLPIQESIAADILTHQIRTLWRKPHLGSLIRQIDLDISSCYRIRIGRRRKYEERYSVHGSVRHSQ
jgi:hypothetical protein